MVLFQILACFVYNRNRYESNIVLFHHGTEGILPEDATPGIWHVSGGGGGRHGQLPALLRLSTHDVWTQGQLPHRIRYLYEQRGVLWIDYTNKDSNTE